jgi:transcriptional regulator with XRE-family HTH domain
MTDSASNSLGNYLKDRRVKLDATALGFALTRRRTPGLRREEIALRANVSTTWYTWLEQGRGGAPSAAVLDRIAQALMLTEVEREYIFLLALGRPPEAKFQLVEGVTPRLQRVLDSLEFNPAYVKTATWDIVAWNRAAAAVLTDYGALPVEQRNILRLLFCDPKRRAKSPHWDSDARFVVAAFRADAARAGAGIKVTQLVDELCQMSPEFHTIWSDNDVRSIYGEAPKYVQHPTAGLIALDYSGFAVDGRPDLGLVIYTAAAPEDMNRIKRCIALSETN